jgi:hypothetical protein
MPGSQEFPDSHSLGFLVPDSGQILFLIDFLDPRDVNQETRNAGSFLP